MTVGRDLVQDPLRVMMSFRDAEVQPNPYVSLLCECLAPEVSVSYFSWRSAFFSDYDVFHFHWPEALVRRDSWLRAFLLSVMCCALIVRSRIRGVAIVRTVHNQEPHEAGRIFERWFSKFVDHSADWFVVLNPVSSVTEGRQVSLAPHGHYRDCMSYESYSRAPVPGRLLFFGHIREYKGLDGLVCAVLNASRSSPAISLVIAGRCSEPVLDAALSSAEARSGGSISYYNNYVSNATLRDLISQSNLVILPYSTFHNSGAALMSLSLDCPILVPRCSESDSLRAEFGENWVHQFTTPISGEALVSAVSESSQASDIGVKVAFCRERQWSYTAEVHLEAYVQAVETVSRASLIRRLAGGVLCEWR